jgi:potassium uptake TrkH family protein
MPVATSAAAGAEPSLVARFRLRHPAQFVVAAFAAAVVVGTVLLALPVAAEGGTAASLTTALFTATSAVCVTGLTVVDTAGYWSGFGETTILVLIQLGGFGFMTLASLLAVVVYRNLGMRDRLLAQTETKAVDLGDIRRVVVSIAVVSIAFEVVTAVVLAIRFAASYGEPAARAAYLGVFHAISAFNNAGFSLYSDSLERFTGDGAILGTIAAAFVVGGIGFPVLFEVRRSWRRPVRWSLHTKLTLVVTALLIMFGTALVVSFEWSNPETLGRLSTPSKLLTGFFHGVTPRTAGFNAVDVGEMNETTQLVTMVLMFIGGGSAGTAGGVKVTTIALLAAMVWAEARGEPTVDIMGKRVPAPAQRQALAVVAAGFGAVVTATLVLMAVAGLGTAPALFETFSAFGTVGMSTGITPDLPTAGRLVLVGLMFAGRVGPITVGAALALTERRRRYRYPEERPIVG